VRIDAIAGVGATDIEIIRHGRARRLIDGELPFNRGLHAGATNIWARSSKLGPEPSTSFRSGDRRHGSRCMPGAAAVSAAVRVCIPRA